MDIHIEDTLNFLNSVGDGVFSKQNLMRSTTLIRPATKDSTKKSYVSASYGIGRELQFKRMSDFVSRLDDVVEYVVESRKGIPTRLRVAFNSIFGCTNFLPYKEKMMNASVLVAENHTNEMTPKDIIEWKNPEEIEAIIAHHKALSDREMLLPNGPQHLNSCVDYLIVLLYSGADNFPVRRLVDYAMCSMYESQAGITGNYLESFDSGKRFRFVFRIYKTAKFSGIQVVDVPVGSRLECFLRHWRRHNPSHLLVFNRRMVQFTSSALSAHVKAVFKNTGANILRHIQATDGVAKILGKDAVRKMEEIQRLAEGQSHSVSTMFRDYVKN